MNPNTPESNALLEQSQKEDKIKYLEKNGFNRSTLKGDTLATLRQKANAISFDNFQMEMRKVGEGRGEVKSKGKGKSKSKRKGKRKRKGSRRHKTRRHFKK
jgi:hypothetical protein